MQSIGTDSRFSFYVANRHKYTTKLSDIQGIKIHILQKDIILLQNGNQINKTHVTVIK